MFGDSPLCEKRAKLEVLDFPDIYAAGGPYKNVENYNFVVVRRSVLLMIRSAPGPEVFVGALL